MYIYIVFFDRSLNSLKIMGIKVILVKGGVILKIDLTKTIFKYNSKLEKLYYNNNNIFTIHFVKEGVKHIKLSL